MVQVDELFAREVLGRLVRQLTEEAPLDGREETRLALAIRGEEQRGRGREVERELPADPSETLDLKPLEAEAPVSGPGDSAHMRVAALSGKPPSPGIPFLAEHLRGSSIVHEFLWPDALGHAAIPAIGTASISVGAVT